MVNVVKYILRSAIKYRIKPSLIAEGFSVACSLWSTTDRIITIRDSIDQHRYSESSTTVCHVTLTSRVIDDADGLFIDWDAIRAVEIIERAEQALGKSVLSAIQTLFWQCLRASGYTDTIQGYGRLLRE